MFDLDRAAASPVGSGGMLDLPGSANLDGRLERYANSASPQVRGHESQERRSNRHSRRAILWKLSTLERVTKCGRVMSAGQVAVRVREGVAGLAGLCTCGSVWACPVCNSKVMARRAVEIGAIVGGAQALGLSVGMVTLTMRHFAGQRLADLWDGVAAAWRSVVSGKAFDIDKRASGYFGVLRCIEVTYGRNGWHVHVHALVLLRHPGLFERLGFGMWQRWSSTLRRHGFADPLLAGQDWHLIEGPADLDLAAYLSKVTDLGRIDLELTSTQTKGARGDFGTEPWWSLLSSVAEDGDADALRLWHEWESGSKGRRMHTGLTRLLRELGLGDSKSDEAIAAEAFGTEDDTVVFITADGWHSLVGQPALIPKMLTTLENTGFFGLSSFLDSHKIDYLRCA